ncbi:MAG: hypothetical protein KJ011_16770 [Burkholderiaceae bacterium]|nr:hypothetical protein [Burkholderiaceae bacterium]
MAAASIAPGGASAQAGSDAEARYQQERALCESGLSPQDRAACLREAAAARAEARHGQLGDGSGDAARYLENALARCKPLPPAERADCEYRVRGGGTARGSVEEGGIYRETVTREVAPPSEMTPAAPQIPPETSPRPSAPDAAPPRELPPREIRIPDAAPAR